jgi:hypothetical protein
MDPHWLVRPATRRKLWIGFAVVLAATLAADLFVAHDAHFGYDGTFGFGAWYGFLTCVAMILGAKALGVFLKRPDGYYAEDDDA